MLGIRRQHHSPHVAAARASASSRQASTTSISNRSEIWRRVAALLEVAGVFVAGNVAASFLAQWLGIRSLGVMLESALEESEPNLVPLTATMLEVLGVQYGCLFLLAFVIGWWHRRRTPARCGVTTAGQSWTGLIAVGLLGFCLVALPFKLLWIVQQHVSMGAGSFWWALFAKSWTPSFWLFFFVGSFGVVPFIEELFFRGYCQSRLEEDFGGPGALVLAALIFVFAHGQYHQVSYLSVATLFCLLPMALGLGYVYLRTRSLVPCIAMHAALNFPTKGIHDLLMPALMVVALVVFRRQWMPAVRDFGQQMFRKNALGGSRAWLMGVAVVYALFVVVGIQRWPNVTMPVALGGLAVALGLEFLERRAARSCATPRSGTSRE